MAGFVQSNRRVTHYSRIGKASYTLITEDEAVGMAAVFGTLGGAFLMGSLLVYLAGNYLQSTELHPLLFPLGIFALLNGLCCFFKSLPFRYVVSHLILFGIAYSIESLYSIGGTGIFYSSIVWVILSSVAIGSVFLLLWPYPGKFALTLLAILGSAYVFMSIRIQVDQVIPGWLEWYLLFGGIIFALAAIVIRDRPRSIMDIRQSATLYERGE